MWTAQEEGPVHMSLGAPEEVGVEGPGGGLVWTRATAHNTGSRHCGNAYRSARWKLLETSAQHVPESSHRTWHRCLQCWGSRVEWRPPRGQSVSHQVGKDTRCSQGLDSKCWKLPSAHRPFLEGPQGPARARHTWTTKLSRFPARGSPGHSVHEDSRLTPALCPRRQTRPRLPHWLRQQN